MFEPPLDLPTQCWGHQAAPGQPDQHGQPEELPGQEEVEGELTVFAEYFIKQFDSSTP